MKRFLWLWADWSKSTFAGIKQLMSKDEYSRKKNRGFRLESVREDFIGGRYIEKKEITDMIEDPFGDTLTFKRVQYDVFSFSMRQEFPGLELIDPPRHITPFLNRVAELAKFSIQISPLNLDLLKVIKHLEANSVNVIVTGVQCSGVPLSTNVAAQFVFSGTDDVREYIFRLVGKKPFSIDRIKALCKSSDWKIQCDVSKRGSFRVLEEPDKDFMRLFQESIRLNTCSG